MAEVIKVLPELTGNEQVFIGGLIKEMSENQAQTFATAYRSQRKDPTTILLLTLVGFIGINGIQRFYLDQIGMGLFYFFTGGFCWIGTLIDLINYQKMAFENNSRKAQQIAISVKSVA